MDNQTANIITKLEAKGVMLTVFSNPELDRKYPSKMQREEIAMFVVGEIEDSAIQPNNLAGFILTLTDDNGKDVDFFIVAHMGELEGAVMICTNAGHQKRLLDYLMKMGEGKIIYEQGKPQGRLQ